jgi:hypothetical protein
MARARASLLTLRLSSGLCSFTMAVALQAIASADSWPAARTTEVFSESREWFVRVIPGRSLGDTFGFSGQPNGPYAKGEWYRRAEDRSYRLMQETTLANPVAPVKFFVTDRGYLVTLDNWHNMGYGKTVASYAPDGRRVAAYELRDLFSPGEVRAFRTSVSSIWWRTDTAYLREGPQSLYIAITGSGAEFIYEPENGAWQYCERRKGVHQCRHANDPRAWGPFREPGAP